MRTYTRTFVLTSLMISASACSLMTRRPMSPPPPNESRRSEERMILPPPTLKDPTDPSAKTVTDAAVNGGHVPEITTKPPASAPVTTEKNSSAVPNEVKSHWPSGAAPAADQKAEAAHEKAEMSPVPAPADDLSVTLKSANAAAITATKVGEDKPVPLTGVSAEKSLGWLKNGNKRFVKGYLRKDGETMADIKRVALNQKPHAIVLSCSDSRVPPELIFDQKLGEIFVIRNAGPDIGLGVIASVEYAVEALNTHLLVVMGHTYCGAVQAAVSTMKNPDAGSPALNHLVAAMHPRLASLQGHETSEGLRDEAWANINGVAKELVEKSALIRDAVASGSLKIEEAVYDLNLGKVDFKEN